VKDFEVNGAKSHLFMCDDYDYLKALTAIRDWWSAKDPVDVLTAIVFRLDDDETMIAEVLWSQIPQ